MDGVGEGVVVGVKWVKWVEFEDGCVGFFFVVGWRVLGFWFFEEFGY